MKIKVYIHVGPPKTGTSAIQNWLVNNVNTLMRHGIYYPNHTLDNNGVSSGNVLDLFDRDENKQLHFSPQKAQETLNSALATNAEILLLSSEFFFIRLDAILAYFSDASVICYLRYPLDTNESGYNQQVKRHFKTKKHGIPSKPKTPSLDKLDEYLQRFGAKRFIVRPYHLSLFHKGSIVPDFLSIFGLAHLSPDSAELVNKSYTFEALECKRWFNQFPLVDMHHILDRYLQGEKEGCAHYSVLTVNKRKIVRQNMYPKIKSFVEKANIVNAESFLHALLHGDKRPFRKQVIGVDEFTALLQGFLHSDPQAPILTEQAIHEYSQDTLLNAQFLDIVKQELAVFTLRAKRKRTFTYRCKALVRNRYRKLRLMLLSK